MALVDEKETMNGVEELSDAELETVAGGIVGGPLGGPTYYASKFSYEDVMGLRVSFSKNGQEYFEGVVNAIAEGTSLPSVEIIMDDGTPVVVSLGQIHEIVYSGMYTKL